MESGRESGGGGGGGGEGEAVEAIHLNTEEEVERLLSEKLVDGFLLLEKACPACVTPLVKRDAAWSPRFPIGYHPQQQQQPPGATNFESSKSYDNLTYGAGLDSVAYESPIQPIAGVPFCVSCQAHVVTSTEEVVVLESADHLKVRGTIMVAMSRETLDDGDESALTPWAAEPKAENPKAIDPDTSNVDAATDEQHVEETADGLANQYPSSSTVPGIEAIGSKFSTKSILKSRSDHFSSKSGSNGVQSTSTSTPNYGAKLNGMAAHPIMMNDDEDDEISLQEIEVVHLDDQTDNSEMERRVVEANMSSSHAPNDAATTTAERIFLSRPSTEVSGRLDGHPEEEEEEAGDMDSYHSSHYNQQVERNPLRSSSKRFGGDSVANTSVAVLRSDTSIPIYATESRGASTSVAALRGGPSFPVAFRHGGVVGGGGDSPTNTSLAVLRGDPSFPVRPAASHAQASIQNHLGSHSEVGEPTLRTSPTQTPLLRSDKMERANNEATPNVDESVSAAAVRNPTADVSHTTTLAIRNVHERNLADASLQPPSKTESENPTKVDRYRSLITHSEETPSPASFHQAARQSASIDSSPASYGPKPMRRHAAVARSVPQGGKVTSTEQASQQSVPVEALISYDERYGH